MLPPLILKILIISRCTLGLWKLGQLYDDDFSDPSHFASFIKEIQRDDDLTLNTSAKISYLGVNTIPNPKDLIALAAEIDICACNNNAIGDLMSNKGSLSICWCSEIAFH